MIEYLLLRCAARIAAMAHLILPPDAKDWGLAMKSEVAGLERGTAAFPFAIGCLHAATAERVAALLDHLTISNASGAPAMDLPTLVARHPFRAGLTCAVTATGLGLFYLSMGQAPLGYLAVNAMALLLGLITIQAISQTSRGKSFDAGLAALLLGLALVVSVQLGLPLNGAVRWLRVGGVTVQPSLLLVPLLAVCMAASRNAMAAWGVALAAAGLALQPDRAMAGALAGAAGVVAIIAHSRHTIAAAAVAAVGFAITLLRPDLQSAMPFVDQVYHTAFFVHPLAGVAVISGAVLLILPALGAARAAPQHRAIHAAFGAVWLGIVVAAGLGNYPTPVVGFSGSAVLGYVLSLLLFHPSVRNRLKQNGASMVGTEQSFAQLHRAVA